MTGSEWVDVFFKQLSTLFGRVIEREADEAGWSRAWLGKLGLLIMAEDDDEPTVWLLDAEGRTGGPVWTEERDDAGARAAASGVKGIIDATPPNTKFTARPPGARDRELEEVMNDAWRPVKQQIDLVSPSARSEDGFKAAMRTVSDYIDAHVTGSKAEKDCPGLAELFKDQAAHLLRGTDSSGAN
ncbi:MAG TPA: hypothetical protein VJP76_03845 [Candidatus Tumulicola sp.]|nr:hypothetical protein [Candidatus Tumulicola sp.]